MVKNNICKNCPINKDCSHVGKRKICWEYMAYVLPIKKDISVEEIYALIDSKAVEEEIAMRLIGLYRIRGEIGLIEDLQNMLSEHQKRYEKQIDLFLHELNLVGCIAIAAEDQLKEDRERKNDS